MELKLRPQKAHGTYEDRRKLMEISTKSSLKDVASEWSTSE